MMLHHLAEAVAGSEAQFVQLMNAEAKRLGMKDTHLKQHRPARRAALHLGARPHHLSAAIINDYPHTYPTLIPSSLTATHITSPTATC